MTVTLDIKVLRVIHYLVTNGSVTKTADLLDVSPGAVSYMLNKARQFTGSALFTRSGSGMVPDNVARELSTRYLNIKRELSGISGSSKLENRAVTISTYSLLEFMISKEMSDKSEFPAMFDFSPPELDCDMRLRRLRSKEVDIDIGTRLQADRSIVQVSLFKCGLNVFMSKNHPLASKNFTLQDWSECHHIRWSRRMDFICNDYKHASRFYTLMNERNISVISSDSLNMAMLCAFSDHIMLLPEVLSKNLEHYLPIVSVTPPHELQMQFECFLHYHHSLSGDKSLTLILDKLQNITRNENLHKVSYNKINSTF